MSNPAFMKFAALAAFMSVITTLGVHFIDFPAEAFEERALLARNQLYIAHRWMIIVHCLMVIISMCGAALVTWKYNKGLTILGMLFFSVFGIAEITRMFSVLAWLNPMREKYLAATEEGLRQILQMQIESFSQGTLILFLVFILAFALGNLFYGMSLLRATNMDRWMGWAFMACAVLTLLAFGNTFWENPLIEKVVDLSSKLYTPLLRAGVGVWLFRKASGVL